MFMVPVSSNFFPSYNSQDPVVNRVNLFVSNGNGISDPGWNAVVLEKSISYIGKEFGGIESDSKDGMKISLPLS